MGYTAVKLRAAVEFAVERKSKGRAAFGASLSNAVLGIRANYFSWNPCKMLPLTGTERKVRLRRANENASLRFHGRSETIRAIVQ